MDKSTGQEGSQQTTYTCLNHAATVRHLTEKIRVLYVRYQKNKIRVGVYVHVKRNCSAPLTDPS